MDARALGAVLGSVAVSHRIDGGDWPNERYLHHELSRRLQVEHSVVVCPKDGSRHTANLHPEWPTFKMGDKRSKSAEQRPLIPFAKYRRLGIDDGLRRDEQLERSNRNTRVYCPVAVQTKNAKGGFVDFALGDYRSPRLGVELTHQFDWNGEAFAYDVVKLLDKRVPFEAVYSLNFVLRYKQLSRMGAGDNFRAAMDDAAVKAVRRLNAREQLCGDRRRVWIVVVELAANHERKIWHLTPEGFKSEVPPTDGITGCWPSLTKPGR